MPNISRTALGAVMNHKKTRDESSQIVTPKWIDAEVMKRTAHTTLPLKTAAARIREACKGRSQSPFFYVCGAGISVPSVPLAWAITEECRKRAQELGLAVGEPPDDPAGSYSYWLEQAWPDPDQRRAFFRAKIEGRPLTDAVLRLAHLMGSGAPSRLLVTPNFDDFVSRALHLFAHPHVVCDHPATTARIDLGSDDAQVLHVHGTYWFYDLVNTDTEIYERAEGMRAGPGMSEILDDVLRNRSPLVVGYSGWEGDVIMRALKSRMRSGLRHQLYWFSYSHDGIESLPAWLREHPNVSFVLPEPSETLPADRVFDALLREFRVEAPLLTKNPLRSFADHLSKVAPERSDNAPPDLYFFEDIIHRVRDAANEAGEGRGRSDTEDAVERVRDAVRRGRYALAARYSNNVELASVSRAGAQELESALWPALARGGADASEDLRIADAYLRIADSQQDAPHGRLASALIRKTSALLRQGHHRKAAAAARASLERVPRMPRAALRLLVLEARALAADGRLSAAMAIHDAIPIRFRPHRQLRIRAEVAGARRERATLLAEAGHPQEAFDTLESVIADLGGARSHPFRMELARALETRAEWSEDAHQAASDRATARALRRGD